MAVRVLMPALSPTMTEGNLAKWHKKEGEAVSPGDVLAEIETDKATMEVEAVDEGVLGRIVVPDGTQGVQVNAVIAVILEEGEDKSVLDGMNLGGAAPAPAEEAKKPAEPAKPKEAAPALAPAAPAPKPAPAPAPAPAVRSGAAERIFASPLARRMADQAGLDLAALAGSGPHGRIVKADIEAAIASGAPARAPAAAAAAPALRVVPTAPAPAAAPGAEYEDVPASNMRRVIARRLVEAKQLVPHFYMTIDCEIDGLLKIRKELNARSESHKLSVNDFVIRASALALHKLPNVNASWLEGTIRLYKTVDVSVAVATEEGLVTPIIRNADRKGLLEISEEMRELARRARLPTKDKDWLKPEEYQGGTFSISNLGMYGIKHFEAIINPPQSCILAVGAGEQRAVVKDGALAIATIMSVTLSCDHRVVDGAAGAEFLKVFKGLIEDPLTMLL
jgi:pyruvate dehydrogenase E2 component (dihydrolipoamide acetyltransferase)